MAAVSQYDGGLTVTKEMKKLLKHPGPISLKNGGNRLRGLYAEGSLNLDYLKLSPLGSACYTGVLRDVQKIVESGSGPDLGGSETPYKFGYATLVVGGSQRVRSGPPGSLKHLEVLNFLIAHGLAVDLEDIVGITALGHAVTGANEKVDLALALITAGANVNHRNRYGEVALLGSFQQNYIAAIDLLMEHGADLDLGDADGVTPRSFFLSCGPQVSAVVCKWDQKRKGIEAPRLEKKCDSCGKDGLPLKNCSRCHVARYCSVDCQRTAWPSHKPNCKPFSEDNTATVKPYYHSIGSVVPTAVLTRQALGIRTQEPPQSHSRAGHVPNNPESKNIIIKVQVPVGLSGIGDLFVYTKKRDFVCTVRRQDSPTGYDRISQVVRSKGVGGLKAYFAAELRNKDKLVVKVSEVLAEQPF